MAETIRIAIADDHPLFRDGVVLSLSSNKDFDVVGQAGNGEEAIELAKELLPDVLLLDIQMPDTGGILAAEKISSACPLTKIIMLTVSENHDDLMRAFKAGAKGYVLKGVSSRELANVIRSVAAGDIFVSPDLASNILFEMTLEKPTSPFDELTDREREILMLLSEGLTNREIGVRLHLAEKTIKHYMSNVLQKLHVRSRVEAALLAQQHKLLSNKE
jgi:DNA-binding NarL/FixJ family response regulator